MSEQQLDRLRRFVLTELATKLSRPDHKAVAALAGDPDEDAWRPWQEVKAEGGQWFLWRDPMQPGDMHADQVEPNEDGFIEMKHGCGLDFYPECQAAVLADDVREAIEAGDKARAEFQLRYGRL